MPLFGKKEVTLAEIEEETEKKQAENELAGTEVSLAQKRVAIAELKKKGLSPKHFGGDWGRIWAWLKSDSLLRRK